MRFIFLFFTCLFGGFGIILCVMHLFSSFDSIFPLVVIFGLAAICFCMFCKSNNAHKAKKQLAQSQKTAGKKKMRYCSHTASGYCLSGLPYGESPCIIKVYSDCIEFLVDKNVTSLDMDKVVSACVKTQKELTSASVGSAVMGAALFGTLGAIIASRPKNKTEYILVINYFSGEAKTILVSFEKSEGYAAMNIAEYLTKHAMPRGYTEL